MSQFIFDVVLIIDGKGYVYLDSDLHIHFLPEGAPWEETHYLRTLEIKNDLIARQKLADEFSVRILRSWNRDWFFLKILEALDTTRANLEKELSETRDNERTAELVRLLVKSETVRSLIEW